MLFFGRDWWSLWISKTPEIHGDGGIHAWCTKEVSFIFLLTFVLEMAVNQGKKLLQNSLLFFTCNYFSIIVDVVLRCCTVYDSAYRVSTGFWDWADHAYMTQKFVIKQIDEGHGTVVKRLWICCFECNPLVRALTIFFEYLFTFSFSA